MTNAANDGQPAGLDFLDFVFTIAMGIGLTPEILGRDYITGLLSEQWARTVQFPQGQDLFNLGVFLLGFLTLTLSWFGYHGSIRKRPLKYDTLSGMLRFIIDVLLVIIYGVILVKYRHFHVVLFLLLLVHTIFVIWDLLKITEHWNTYQARGGSHLYRFRREYVSVVSFVLFLLVWASAGVLPQVLTLILAIAVTVLYRVNKIYPTWERLFGVRSG